MAAIGWIVFVSIDFFVEKMGIVDSSIIGLVVSSQSVPLLLYMKRKYTFKIFFESFFACLFFGILYIILFGNVEIFNAFFLSVETVLLLSSLLFRKSKVK